MPELLTKLISEQVMQRGAIWVLVASLYLIAYIWYKYIVNKDKEHKKERKEMRESHDNERDALIDMHRKEREQRQERDDKRLAMYQASNELNTKAVHELSLSISNLNTIMQKTM